jgi:hypothetical protein
MRGSRLSDLGILALLTLGLAACAETRTIDTRRPPETVGNQGSAWESVLGSPEIPIDQGWELARLDEAMNIRGNIPLETPPSLDDLRRLYLNPRPDQVLYFRRWR